MDKIVAAAFLGLSFGNLWLCVLLVLSLTSTNRSTCLGYLLGRALAILALSVVISLLGAVVAFDKDVLDLASGLLLVGFALYLGATRLLGWTLPWSRRGAPASACHGACAGCAAHDHPKAHSLCQDCHDDKMCDAEAPELRDLSAAARGLRGREVGPAARGGFWFGVGLGALRGGAVCAKLVVLVPLLVQASVGQALLMAIAFTVTSSLYPVLGFLFGDWALSAVRHKRALVTAGVVALLGTGGWYVWHGLG